MRTCLIIGNAANFREDLEAVKKFDCAVDFTIAVKRTIYQYSGQVDVFATLHPEMVADHIRRRFDAGFDMSFDVYTSKHVQLDHHTLGIKDILVYEKDWGGSSGLYAVQIATQIYSFDRILLAGMPLDQQPRAGDEGRWAPSDRGIARYREAWEKHFEQYASKVRSLSGWTQQLLGAPDKYWLG